MGGWLKLRGKGEMGMAGGVEMVRLDIAVGSDACLIGFVCFSSISRPLSQCDFARSLILPSIETVNVFRVEHSLP